MRGPLSSSPKSREKNHLSALDMGISYRPGVHSPDLGGLLKSLIASEEFSSPWVYLLFTKT